MRKVILFAILAVTAVFGFASCDKSLKNAGNVNVALQIDGEAFEYKDAKVTLTDGVITLEATTDEKGVASFQKVAVGNWAASTSFKVKVEKEYYTYSGAQTAISVVAGKTIDVPLPLIEVEFNPIIIKEFYVGGCQKDDGSGSYANDAYIILYNNSELNVDATDVCFAIPAPISATGSNKYIVEGEYIYEKEGWMPALYSVWWFNTDVEIAPYSQIVIAITGAIDHTQTYKNSVNLSKADFCFYDPDSGYNNASKYPAPDSSIPASHYLKTYVFGMGNAWPVHQSQPGIFIFKMGISQVEALSKNAEAYDHTGGASAAMNAIKIPFDCILDVIEGWGAANVASSTPRFPACLNSGYVAVTGSQGYTIYRNVDKEATEALPENEGKIVYGYSLGTDKVVEGTGTTDPSGIDAEASIKAGAHIIYSETQNTATDFHQRKISSLK
ncbi:MAG: DUF4876 domain-containing protein [Bacteroidales bacterium]|nr:DUF4876 domain-containing protein [Bacteroidales bacterium]